MTIKSFRCVTLAIKFLANKSLVWYTLLDEWGKVVLFVVSPIINMNFIFLEFSYCYHVIKNYFGLLVHSKVQIPLK